MPRYDAVLGQFIYDANNVFDRHEDRHPINMKLKIRGGTSDSSQPGLCMSCKKAVVVQGQNLKEEIIQCEELYGDHRIRFKVTSCNKYLEATHMTIREMEDMAWILRTDDKARQIGFIRHKDMDDKDKDKWTLTHRRNYDD